MSDKFDMKLVIDAVTTPLLYEKLIQAGSARVRAALLRSLAEAALRGTNGVTANPHVVDVDLAAGARSTAVVATVRSEPAPVLRVAEPPPPNASEVHLLNENGDASAHDVDQLADAFGSYF